MAKIQLEAFVANMTPEQKIFCQWFYGHFDNNIGAHHIILNIEPLFYQGTIAGTEFLTYNNTKLYLAFKVENTYPSANTAAFTRFYNEVDAISYELNGDIPYWDVTAAIVKYSGAGKSLTNLYFSRFAAINYTKMLFIGYRVTLN